MHARNLMVLGSYPATQRIVQPGMGGGVSRVVSIDWPYQGGRARSDFSLAWLEAAWYSSGSGHGPTRNWHRDAGVLKKLSLAGLAKLSRLRYSWLRFCLALADYHGLRGDKRLVYTAGYLTADSTEQHETHEVSPLSLAERGKSCPNFLTKTPASVKGLPGYPVQNCPSSFPEGYPEVVCTVLLG